jgi:glutamate formiminotransferase
VNTALMQLNEKRFAPKPLFRRGRLLKLDGGRFEIKSHESELIGISLSWFHGF